MAFEFSLDAPCVPYPGLDGDWIVEFPLGFDLDANHQVMMTVALVEDEVTKNDPFELIFGIRTVDFDTSVASPPQFDHQTARLYVSKERSAAVLHLICDCVRALLESVNPSSVAMVTHEANLPGPAMGKYMNICNMLGLCGYGQIKYERDATDGRDHWLFTK
jgi:hypothetical protein